MTNDKEQILSILEKMSEKHITVIGDMIVDRYVQGDIERISREAPVLVLQQTDEKIVAGGAANVVNNIATLGGYVTAVGLLGEDKPADGLREILQVNSKINIDGLISTKACHTITKTRIIAGGRATVSQQVVRIDCDNHEPMSVANEQLLLQKLQLLLPDSEGIVLSDYGSGTITPHIRRFIIDYANAHNIPAIVDSRYAINDFKGITYVKQNDAELSSAVGRPLKTLDDLSKAGFSLLNSLHAKGILVTRGEKGMSLFEKDQQNDIPVSDKSEVYDVSGAGDTCVAAFILALAAGSDPVTATKLSNYAAGIAVRKIGTATVLASELIQILGK